MFPPLPCQHPELRDAWNSIFVRGEDQGRKGMGVKSCLGRSVLSYRASRLINLTRGDEKVAAGVCLYVYLTRDEDKEEEEEEKKK